jgi:hypothetical protein
MGAFPEFGESLGGRTRWYDSVCFFYVQTSTFNLRENENDRDQTLSVLTYLRNRYSLDFVSRGYYEDSGNHSLFAEAHTQVYVCWVKLYVRNTVVFFGINSGVAEL